MITLHWLKAIFCCCCCEAWEIRRKKINQSHYFASFAYVRFFYPFSSKYLQLNWFDAFVFQAKTFNLLLKGWPLMCISTILSPSTVAIFYLVIRTCLYFRFRQAFQCSLWWTVYSLWEEKKIRCPVSIYLDGFFI